MSEIPRFSYELLWGERSLCSVANLTRQDGQDFMRLAAELDLKPVTQTFDLEHANEAIAALRAGDVRGAAVLSMTRAGKKR